MMGSNISVENSWKASMSSELSGIVPADSKLPDHAASASAVPASGCIPYVFEIVPVKNVSQLIRRARLEGCVLTFEAAHSCELADVFQAVQDEVVFVVQLLEHCLCLVK
jgi:hypothetical protein